MSFFHSIPSAITRLHSLQTTSAAHRDLASRKDRTLSAIWSRPLAVKQQYIIEVNVLLSSKQGWHLFKALPSLVGSSPTLATISQTVHTGATYQHIFVKTDYIGFIRDCKAH